jgi:DNA polymerase-4
VARTVTLKVKYADFQQITRSRSSPAGVTAPAELEQLSFQLLRPLFPPRTGVRLLGVSLSNFNDRDGPSHQQLPLALE